jgi:hypothetical protein
MTPKKPSENEEEYFHRLEQERIARRKAEAAAQQAAAEREQLRKLTHLRCPKCAAKLESTTYRGVEIDRCPECRGVWFDAGEARRVIEAELKEGGGFITDLFGTLTGQKRRGQDIL